MLADKQLIDLLKTAIFAGDKIIEIYNSDFSSETKSDNSPLTEADKCSHQTICRYLQKAHPAIPILSEEGKTIPYEERKKWNSFWLIDPLDGTKEFIKKNGEFTVNIALIKDNLPILGIIYLPVKETLYFAVKDFGSYRTDNAKQTLLSKTPASIKTLIAQSNRLPLTIQDKPYTVVASRSHMSEETEQFIEDLKKIHPGLALISSGSSIKFCLVADGSADIYPRFGPTSEWDTAAAQAIVSEAGKNVFDMTTNEIMRYNKKNVLNNYFVVK